MDSNNWLAPTDISHDFIAECKRAVDDPIAFASFRQGKAMTCIVENKPPHEAISSWYYVKSMFPYLCDDKGFLNKMDRIGSPSKSCVLFDFNLSPTRVSH